MPLRLEDALPDGRRRGLGDFLDFRVGGGLSVHPGGSGMSLLAGSNYYNIKDVMSLQSV